MARYAEIADLDEHGLPAAALTGLTTDQKNAALDAASSLAEGYLVAAGYALPLSAWGDDLRRCVAHIATWDLLARRGFNPDRPIDQVVRQRYEDAMRWLERVAAGTIRPPAIVDDTPDAPPVAAIVFTDRRRGW